MTKHLEPTKAQIAAAEAMRGDDGAIRTRGTGRFKSARTAAMVIANSDRFDAMLDAAGPRGSAERRAAFLAHFNLKG